jgi:ABC-type phosphate transport system substrate-binding protein
MPTRVSRHVPTKRRRRFFGRTVATIVLGILLFHEEPSVAAGEGFRVIVDAKSPITVAERSFVASVFLKRASRWEDGRSVHPADLHPNAAARQTFSQQVLKRSVKAVRSYWQQRIFSGREVPPLELASDEAMVQYVATHLGAIGYVSPNAKLENVKVLALK